ncbi:hypothetical protein amrb99_24820 [Actinomadura sp. RB99]|uniref:hypothetical protein n=1 Tax=Actinomadura sp. RB99 TaxID=2691577 RepID=UPI001688FB59|nr:hypothetical protein [Actinomadura sp. RB99]MBD2893560.1 hypothetical protein [Actinomadura sp. RB99]
MANKTTGGEVSARWYEPAQSEDGGHWSATLRVPLLPSETAGLESQVFGPTREFCVAETERADILWYRYPSRGGDDARCRARLAWLRSGGKEGAAL